MALAKRHLLDHPQEEEEEEVEMEETNESDDSYDHEEAYPSQPHFSRRHHQQHATPEAEFVEDAQQHQHSAMIV